MAWWSRRRLAMRCLGYDDGMSTEPIPKGIPATREDWESLSDATRKWVMEIMAERNEFMRRCRLAREGGQSGRPEDAEASSTRDQQLEEE